MERASIQLQFHSHRRSVALPPHLNHSETTLVSENLCIWASKSLIPVEKKMPSTSIEEEIGPADALSRATDIDNTRIVHLQRQLMKEQDEELEKLAETIRNTNHIAWAINEEFRLLDEFSLGVNKYVEVPDSKLQRAERRLATLNKRRSCGACSWSLLFLVIGFIVLAAVIYMLAIYL